LPAAAALGDCVRSAVDSFGVGSRKAAEAWCSGVLNGSVAVGWFRRAARWCGGGEDRRVERMMALGEFFSEG